MTCQVTDMMQMLQRHQTIKSIMVRAANIFKNPKATPAMVKEARDIYDHMRSEYDNSLAFLDDHGIEEDDNDLETLRVEAREVVS